MGLEFYRIRALAFGLVAAFVAGGQGAYEQPRPSEEPVMKSYAAPNRGAARYVTPDGATGFVLDRSRGDVRLQFDGTDEVLLLRDGPAPGGARLLRFDTGDVALRQTPWGSLTLFTPEARGGVPVDAEGSAAPLDEAAPSIPAVEAAAAELGAFAGKRIGQPVEVTIDRAALIDSESGRATLLGAITNARLALNQYTHARGTVPALSQIAFVLGETPGGHLDSGRWEIAIAPDEGLAGRASSRALAQTLAP